MNKFRIARAIAFVLAMILIIIPSVDTTVAFVVTETLPIVNTFLPLDEESGNIVITKSIEHPYGADYVVPDNILFDFEVDLGEYYAGTVIETTDGHKSVDENGIAHVYLAPGSSVAIEGIEQGRTVTVTEIDTPDDGFSVRGNSSVTVTIPETGNAVIPFVNVYEPAPATGGNITVTGTKLLDGREWRGGDRFTFELTMQDSSGKYILLGEKTVATDENVRDFNVFDFSDVMDEVEFDSPGVYTFRIIEEVGDIKDIVYDKSECLFNVTVGDGDMDGTLEVQRVTGKYNARVAQETGGYSVDTLFVNKYSPGTVPPPEDIEIDVNIEKTVINKGTDSISPKNFEFLLKDLGGSGESRVVTGGDGKAVFILRYSADDVGKTFRYLVSEVASSRPGVTYSKAVYEVAVKISLGDDGKLKADLSVDGTAVDGVTLKFENIYEGAGGDTPTIPDTPVPEDITVNITVNKTVDNRGKGSITPDGFKFVLRSTKGDKEYTAVSDTDGRADFALSYSADDAGKTFTYKLTEFNDGRQGVTYSTQNYDVQIGISLGDDGKLYPKIMCNGHLLEGDVEFVNTYYHDDGGVKPDPPQTGDFDVPVLSFVMFFSGVIMLLLLFFTRKKRKKEA